MGCAADMGTVRRENGQVIVAPAAMQYLVEEIFTHTGCSHEEAQRIAIRLTGANLRGHDSHGMIRTPDTSSGCGMD